MKKTNNFHPELMPKAKKEYFLSGLYDVILKAYAEETNKETKENENNGCI